MGRAERDRRSRMSEFRDHDQEWQETKSRDAAVRRQRAIHSKDMRTTDSARAYEFLVGRNEDYGNRMKDLLRKLGSEGFHKEATND